MTVSDPRPWAAPGDARVVRNEHGIQVELAYCGACRACELACSFYLTGTYNPSASAIRVTFDAHIGGVEAEFTPACDGCARASGKPVCIEACTPEAVSKVEPTTKD